MHKTEAIHFKIPNSTVLMLQDAFHFLWKTKAIKYLGIQIPSNLKFLYDLNYRTWSVAWHAMEMVA